MADQEVTIRISAKNLTAEEFAKAREAITGVKDEAKRASEESISSFSQMKNYLTELWEDPMHAVQSFGAKFADTITESVGGAGLVLAGIAIAASLLTFELNKLAMEAVEVGAKMQNMSEITSLPVNQLYRLKFVAEVTGTPLERVTNLIFMMQRRMQESPEKFNDGLQKINMSMQEFEALKGDERLYALARAFRENTDETNRAGVAMDLFGRQGRDNIPFLMKNLDELRDKAKELGIEMSEHDAHAAEEFEMSLNALKAQAGATWTQLGMHVSLAKELSYGWERMKLAVANVALSFVDLIRAEKDLLDVHLQLLGLKAITLPGAPEGGPSSEGFSGKDAGKDPKSLVEGLLKSVNELKAQMPMIDADEEKRQIKKLDDAIKEQEEKRKAAKKQEQVDIKEASEAFHQALVMEIYEADLLRDHMQAAVDPMREAQAALRAGVGITGRNQDLGMQGLAPNAKQLASSLAGTFRTPILEGMGGLFQKDVPASLIAAIQGGGDAYKAVGATIGQHIGYNVGEHIGQSVAAKAAGTLGSKIGGIIGNVVPILGPIIGAIGGKLIGAGIGKLHDLFTGGEGAKVNDMRDQFIAASGGLDVLNRKAHDAGTNLDALLHAKKVKDFEAAVTALNGKMGDFAKDQEKDTADLDAAIQRYGFSIEELGPKMRRQKLDEQAQLIMRDFTLLAGSGIDVDTVIKRMGGSINEFVQTSLRTGSEIPEAMRPMLEKMTASGQLLDENGNKITDLDKGGIKWSQTMTEGFAKIADKFDLLLKGLGLLPDKIETAAAAGKEFSSELAKIKDINIKINADWNIPPPPDLGDHEVPGAAAGGLFSRPTMRVIAERQPEVVGSPNAIVEAFSAAMNRTGFGGRGNSEMLDKLGAHIKQLTREIRSQQSMLPNMMFRAIRDAGMV